MNAFAQFAKDNKARAKAKRTSIDLDDLKITDDPVIIRTMPEGKYEEMFSKMKVGQALRCNSAHSNRISNAFRKWLERKARTDLRISSVRDYGDGYGRVWLLPKEKHGKE